MLIKSFLQSKIINNMYFKINIHRNNDNGVDNLIDMAHSFKKELHDSLSDRVEITKVDIITLKTVQIEQYIKRLKDIKNNNNK